MSEKKPIGLMLKQIHNKIEQHVNNKLKSENITLSQVTVLECLFENEKTTVKDLEKKLSLQHPTVIGILKRMAKKGFVEYFTDENDKRCRVIHLTNMAWEEKERLYESRKKMDEIMISGMSEKDLSMLSDMLTKILNNLETGGI